MADSKSTADVLVELIYSWIEKRERCAHQLRKLAEELESHRERCNISETVGSSVSVVGAAALIGAGVATLLTGGAAAPLLIGAAVSGGVGATISVGTKITEHFLSSSTMTEAQEIEKKSNEIAGKIQRQFEQLKKEIKEARSFIDPDEVDRLVINKILGAMARRSSLHRLINFSNNYDLNFSTEVLTDRHCLFAAAATSTIVILAFLAFVADGKHMKRLAGKGTKQLIQLMSTAAFKTALKGGIRVVGGAVGMAFALHEAIDCWKEMIENNHVTEASQSLRDTANAILEMTQTLRKQLDDIIQKLKMLAEVKRCIETSSRSFEEQKTLRQFAIEICKHEYVAWLKESSESDSESSEFESFESRFQTFLKVVNMFNFLKQALEKERKGKGKKKDKTDSESIHIIFVAHGAIEQNMIPANTLRPLSTIEDVVMYSPWNCLINAGVAYGVATGIIEPQHRVFCCSKKHNCQIPDEGHQPTNLPDCWNSMKTAEGQMIPNITVSTLRKPKDGAWERFLFLQDEHGRPEINRIVIPFILPGGASSSLRVPFSDITLALSLVLYFSRYKATVHLAACLGKRPGEKLDEGYLKEQYACTINSTKMKSSEKMLTKKHTDLYQSLYAVFG